MHRREWMIAAATLIAVAPLKASLAQSRVPYFRFAVSDLEIVDRDPPTMRPPRVDHLFPMPLGRVLRSWARDRLIPVGGPYRLRFTIERASVIDTPLLPRDQTLSDRATDRVSNRYDANAAVRLDIIDPTGHNFATARAFASRYQTVLQSTSPAQRDAIWSEMTKQLMATLVPQIDQQIHQHFAAYLR